MKAKFKKAVDNGDLVTARLFLTNELMLDPRGKSFNEMRSYAESTFPNLYEIHNGDSFEIDSDKWGEDLLFSVKNNLDSNFSKERLEYYYKVAQLVLKDKAANLDAEEQRAYHNQKSTSSHNETDLGSSYPRKEIYRGVTFGGTAAAVAGIFIEKTAIAWAVSSLGIVSAVIGGYMLYKESKNE